MTARVGAVHLGWDVVSVAAGGGGSPIRPVQVEGTYTPPAYLLADSSGRLHTAGVDRRPDVGIAISDVRDILGHPQIVVAGATWPADLVFRARLHNPVEAIVKHLGGAPDVIAVPFPDEWPDPKVDEYVRLVELLGYPAEPLPESVALSGYVRALGLVRAPGRGPAVGATGVYSDGRECLVVAVHGDDDRPTESVSVPIDAEALHDARSADNVVIEVMAAARAIDADTSTILLTGNVCFNDALRLAFQNHLGHRFQVADHPMHALVLGAAHLLVADSDAGDHPEPQPRHQHPHASPEGSGRPPAHGAGSPQASTGPAGGAAPGPGPAGSAGASGSMQGDTNAPGLGAAPGMETVIDSPSRRIDQGPRHVPQPQPQSPAQLDPMQRQPEPLPQQPEMVQRHTDSPPTSESPSPRPDSVRPPMSTPSAAPAVGEDEETRRITPDDIAQMNAVVAHHADAKRRAAQSSAQPADPTQRVTADDLARASGAGQHADVTRRVTAEDLAQAGGTGSQQAGASPHQAGAGVNQGDSAQPGTPEDLGQAGSSRSLPPGLANVGSRFTRPPAKASSPADDQMTAVMGRPQQPGTGQPPQQPGGAYAPGAYGAPQGPSTGSYGAVQPGSPGAQPGSPGGYGQVPGADSAGGGYGQVPGYGSAGSPAQGGYGYGPDAGQSGSGYGPDASRSGYGSDAGQGGSGYGPDATQGGSGYGPDSGQGGGGYGPGSGSAAGGYGPGGGSGAAGYGTGSNPVVGGYGQGGNPAAGGYGSAPGGEHGAAGGPGGAYGNAGGQGGSGGYPGAGGGYGPGGTGYGAPGGGAAPGSGNFAGPGGNAPGQGGSGYGGAMPPTGPRPSGSPEDAAGQSDSSSESEGGRKPRKGKLWNKMKDNLFGAPIVVGAAALAAVGMHADDQSTQHASAIGEIGTADSLAGSDIRGIGDATPGLPSFASAIRDASASAVRDASGSTVRDASAPLSFQPASNSAATFDLTTTLDQAGPLLAAFGDWPAVERSALQAGDACAFTPSVNTDPRPGISSIGDPQELDCLGRGTGTLRYSVPGPVRGADPGPPLAI
ncbi:hypothetical protein [Nocardia inohanensis]|uniref:hypothetical protein n=1 Tax=Nocardia inohanensis TaxID=209246 RepID=UPI001FE0553B|nr:hypothetical protein [Nocardia inohanensis]